MFVCSLMAPEKWFCNEEWTPTIEEHFFKKLRRARAKAQYLNIQAGRLCNKHPQVALALLEKFFALEANSIFRADAFLHQAEAYLSLGDKQKAVESFQKALQRQREFPNVITGAWSEYGLLVATEKMSELFDDALKVLQEHRTRLLLPIDQFLWYGIYALITDVRGERQAARDYAAKALHFSGLTDSGLRYHPKLGLVEAQHESLKATLRWLAAEQLA
jgi:tetratricopeptide (TPR) repeat protein